MGSIIGRRPEELEAINMNLRNIMQRLEELELRLSDELGRRVASDLGDVRASLGRLTQKVETLATTQPDYLINEFLEGVGILRSLVSYLTIFQEQQTELSKILEFQKEQVEVLERARSSIAQEKEMLEQERRSLEILKQELASLKQSVEEKEAALRGFESDVAALEEKKIALERNIKELQEAFTSALQSASQQIEKAVRELDRKFKIREARLERLTRLEERKREEIARLEAAKSVVEQYNSQFSQLTEEVRRLERRRSQLLQEINKLESERRELERIKQELRGGILRGLS
jgi:chromosome segregation ATPase